MLAQINQIATPEVLWWALLPLLFFSVSAVTLLTVASLKRQMPDCWAPAWTVAAALATLVSLVPLWQKVMDEGPRSFLGGAVGIDGASLFITGILAVTVLATALLAHPYLKRQDLPGLEFYVLLLLSAAGGVVMASANDLIVLFLGIEVLSIAVYVLAAYHLRRIESQEAALKYFILGAFASAFLLYGIALVYGAVGSTNLSDINAWLAQNILVEDGLLLAGLAMLLVGLGFKVAAAPFHAWTPDVYQGAPSPVVAWMAAGVKAAGFAALLRVFVTTFGSFSADWRPAMAVLAGASVLVGSLGAALQTDIKRLLAYSSVAHAGFLLIGIEAATVRGTSAVFSYLAIYALLAIGSFAVVTLMGGSGDQDHELEAYHGLGARQPWLAGAFTVLLLAQAGVPLTAGFVAKFGVIAAAADVGSWWLASVAMLATAVAAFAYLRVVVAMYLNEPATDETIGVDRTTFWVISVVAALVVLLGLMPSILLDVARQAVPVLVGG